MKTRAIILSILLAPCTATVGCDEHQEGDELGGDTYRTNDSLFCESYDGGEVSIGFSGQDGSKFLTTEGEAVKAKAALNGWTVHCDEDRVLLYRDTESGRRWLLAEGPDVPVATTEDQHVPSSSQTEWKAVRVQDGTSEQWRLESYSCNAGTLGVTNDVAVTISGEPDEAPAVTTEFEIRSVV